MYHGTPVHTPGRSEIQKTQPDPAIRRNYMQTKPFLPVHTHLQSGNLASDKCYSDRNANTIVCTFRGWPQDKDRQFINPNKPGSIITEVNICRGNRNEIELMECLNHSGETGWWKNFTGCDSANQCLVQAYQKHNDLIASKP